MTIVMVICASSCFVSCGDSNSEDKIDLSYNYVYSHLEGRYVGTFYDICNPKTKYAGYVEITAVPNTSSKYKIVGYGDEGISVSGEYWVEKYNPSYDDDGEYGRELAQIVFHDRDFKDGIEDCPLYWYLHSGYMWLHNMQMNLYFKKYIMGGHNSYELRWEYHFEGKKEF